MSGKYDIDSMVDKIELLKRTAEELKASCGGIQAIKKNVDRILASIKMLEINVGDLKKLK